MKTERLEIYGRDFPNGFTSIHSAGRFAREKLSGLPQSYFPRAPKDGEHLIRLQVDPNGTPYDRGDILLDMPINSTAFPGLRGDWEIVQIKARYTTQHDGEINGWYRYAIVRLAKPGEAAKVREITEANTRRVMDRMMNS